LKECKKLGEKKKVPAGIENWSAKGRSYTRPNNNAEKNHEWDIGQGEGRRASHVCKGPKREAVKSV